MTQSSDGHLQADLDPAVDVLPRPGVHADFAAAAALASSNEDAPPDWVEVALGAGASLIRSPARQSRMMRARVRSPAVRSPARRITATISSTVGGSAG